MPATESNYRDVKKVHVVFAVTAVIMLLTTLWMMAADQAREWTGDQRSFEKLQSQKQIAAINSIDTNPQYKTSKEERDAKKEAAEAHLKTIQPDVDAANSRFDEADFKFDHISRQ